MRDRHLLFSTEPGSGAASGPGGRAAETTSQKSFRTVRKTRVSEDIIEQVRGLIASGRLKPGDRLPAERELAQALSVGRSAVREAIRALESLGVVEARAGEGTFVVAVPAPKGHDPITASFYQAWSTQRKLFEVRRVFEPDLAALAAWRATPEQIERMRAILDEQKRKIRAGEYYMKEDAAFHYLVAEATGNEILVRVVDSLMGLLADTRDTARKATARPARSLKQHQAILRAIEARNPLLAERRMRDHIAAIERLVFSSEQQPTGEPDVVAPSLVPETAS